MKLSKWAAENGLTYRTAYNLFKAGNLPVAAEQLVTGTILVTPPKQQEVGASVIYARVSSADQKKDLEAQVGRLSVFAVAQEIAIGQVITEVGSGLNGRRQKLLKMLGNPAISTIIIERRDRLMRFGFEYIEAALAAQGRKILVVDQTELADDLVRDMIEVLTSFCARLYGRRSARNKAERAIEAMKN